MSDADELDRPNEACGVVGVFARPGADVDVARTIFFCLYALQHRGQESAGMAVSDGDLVTLHRGMGLVSQVFHERDLAPMRGHFGVGHTRYSTTGGSQLTNAQPTFVQTLHGPLAVGHNGNLTNGEWMRRHLMERGVGLVSTSDTEVITQFLAMPPTFHTLTEPAWERRLVHLQQVAEGAYSLVVMTRDALFAMRDPLGMRPLCLGQLRDAEGATAWLVASESSALLTVGARSITELKPGEIVRIDADGPRTVHVGAAPRPALCVFEYVYFARPDSVINGMGVHGTRWRMGLQLAKEAPVEADLVFGVPDSSVPAAMALGEALGIPYREGLIKNRYIGRTFIQPTASLRKNSVLLKFNALRENLEGKRVVMVDDSIVRGTTMGPLVKLVREAGRAREVHVRVASPPVRHPCFMGVDLASHDQLIAHAMSVDEICRHVGADSLAYLSIEGLRAAVGEGPELHSGYCDACFSGRYPVDVRACMDAGSGGGR
ncbi:MAG TPA: amidophosphoribosyltransferase [Myxococcota bacterium]|nr:amidophosphoribosyltransferase [Myxococcota bacterium]